MPGVGTAAVIVGLSKTIRWCLDQEVWLHAKDVAETHPVVSAKLPKKLGEMEITYGIREITQLFGKSLDGASFLQGGF